MCARTELAMREAEDARETARRLDSKFETAGIFETFFEHGLLCAKSGGLNGTGIFFLVDGTMAYKQVFRVGEDDDMLSVVIKHADAKPGFRGHGTILGAFVDGDKDCVLLQFIERGGEELITFCFEVEGPVTVDDSKFVWGEEKVDAKEAVGEEA